MSVDRRGMLGFAALAGGVLIGAQASAGVQAGARDGSQENYFVEHLCANLLMRFFNRLDALNRLNAAASDDKSIRAQPDEEANPWALMSADGAWQRNATTIDSKTSFEKAISELPAGLITAHLVCNLIIESTSTIAASASFRLLIFSAISEKGAIPVKLGPPGAILSARAELIRTSANWRIRRIASDTVFHF